MTKSIVGDGVASVVKALTNDVKTGYSNDPVTLVSRWVDELIINERKASIYPDGEDTILIGGEHLLPLSLPLWNGAQWPLTPMGYENISMVWEAGALPEARVPVTPSSVYTSAQASVSGGAPGAVTADLRLDLQAVRGANNLTHAQTYGKSVMLGSNTSAADILLRIFLMMGVVSPLDGGGSRFNVRNMNMGLIAGAVLTPDVVTNYFPLRDNVLAPVINARVTTLGSWIQVLVGTRTADAGWGPAEWGSSVALVPIYTSDTNRTTNGLWTLAHMEYPFKWGVFASSINQVDGTPEHNIACMASENLMRVRGPQNVLYVLVDLNRDANASVVLPGGGAVNTVANDISGNGMANVDILASLANVGGQYTLEAMAPVVAMWTRVSGAEEDWNAAMTVWKDMASLYFPRSYAINDGRTLALGYGENDTIVDAFGPAANATLATIHQRRCAGATTSCGIAPSLSRSHLIGKHAPGIWIGMAAHFYKPQNRITFANPVPADLVMHVIKQNYKQAWVYDYLCSKIGVSWRNLVCPDFCAAGRTTARAMVTRSLRFMRDILRTYTQTTNWDVSAVWDYNQQAFMNANYVPPTMEVSRIEKLWGTLWGSGDWTPHSGLLQLQTPYTFYDTPAFGPALKSLYELNVWFGDDGLREKVTTVLNVGSYGGNAQGFIATAGFYMSGRGASRMTQMPFQTTCMTDSIAQSTFYAVFAGYTKPGEFAFRAYPMGCTPICLCTEYESVPLTVTIATNKANLFKGVGKPYNITYTKSPTSIDWGNEIVSSDASDLSFLDGAGVLGT